MQNGTHVKSLRNSAAPKLCNRNGAPLFENSKTLKLPRRKFGGRSRELPTNATKYDSALAAARVCRRYRRRMANNAAMLERCGTKCSRNSLSAAGGVSAACLPSNTTLCRVRVYLGTLNTRNISGSASFGLPVSRPIASLVFRTARDFSHQPRFIFFPV